MAASNRQITTVLEDESADRHQFRQIQFFANVEDGNVKAVKESIKRHPHWLALKREVHFCGQTRTVTAYQLAQLMRQDDMITLLEAHFRKSVDGETVKTQQFQEIFPNGEPEAAAAFDFSAIVQAITDASEAEVTAVLAGCTEFELYAAIQAFKNDFAEVSSAALCFNPKHLTAAMAVYNRQSDLWKHQKCKLFCKEVMTLLRQFAPKQYAKEFYTPLEIFEIARNGTQHATADAYNLPEVPRQPVMRAFAWSCFGLKSDEHRDVGGSNEDVPRKRR